MAAPAPKRQFSIAWVGDTVLGSSFGLPPDGAAGSLSAAAPLLRGSDLAFANLEGTFSVGGTSKCGSSAAGCYAFQAPPSFARALRAAGIDLVNLANNHSYDFGETGAAQTRAALAAAGVRWTGLPGQVTLARAGGVRVAFVGFAPYPWAASLLDLPAAQELVRRADAAADVVVVAIHAGAEGSDAIHVPHGAETYLGEPRGDSRAFARAVIDAGADLVVGSGPHVVRGVEVYRGRLVAYSLGNFAGYHNFSLASAQALSAVLSVTVDRDGDFVGGRWHSLVLAGPGLPERDPARRSLALARALSREDFGASAARFDATGGIRLPRRSGAEGLSLGRSRDSP